MLAFSLLIGNHFIASDHERHSRPEALALTMSRLLGLKEPSERPAPRTIPRRRVWQSVTPGDPRSALGSAKGQTSERQSSNGWAISSVMVRLQLMFGCAERAVSSSSLSRKKMWVTFPSRCSAVMTRGIVPSISSTSAGQPLISFT